MPAEICLSTQVLFYKEQKLTFLVSITGTSQAHTLVDTTHEQSLKVLVSFGTKNIFTNTKKLLTCCSGWYTSVELHKLWTCWVEI